MPGAPPRNDDDRPIPADPKDRPGRHIVWLIPAAGAAVFFAAILLAFVFGLFDLDAAMALLVAAWEALRSAPAPIYFAFFSVAVLAPIPASLLYITAGPIFGVATSLLWIAPALVVNTLLVHAIASGFLRPRLESLMAHRGLRVPRIASRNDRILFVLLVRVTPGVPYFIQSWLLALSGIERTPFVVITLLVQMVYATGFVVLGQSAFEGNVGLAVGAASGLVVISIAARLLHNRFKRTRAALVAEAESATPG